MNKIAIAVLALTGMFASPAFATDTMKPMDNMKPMHSMQKPMHNKMMMKPHCKMMKKRVMMDGKHMTKMVKVCR